MPNFYKFKSGMIINLDMIIYIEESCTSKLTPPETKYTHVLRLADSDFSIIWLELQDYFELLPALNINAI